MDRMRQELAKRAKDPGEPSTPQPKPPKAATPSPEAGAPVPASQPDPGSSPTDPGSSPPAEPAPAPAPATAGKEKANPWKLVDQYKGRVTELEKQVAEAKTAALAEQQRKEYLTQIEQITKRNNELEEQIRFVDYAKSAEFQTKYQQPYEAAWKRAVLELSEIPVTDPATGQARAASPEDLLALVQMPLGQARDLAEQVFGKFANDVLAHRKELKTLFDAQQAALNEAKTTGAEREKQQRELSQKKQQEIQSFIKETWDRTNGEVLQDPKYGKFFAPVEGDAEGNQRLAKGFELVDRAFSESPNNPDLTPEQRAAIVKRHVALRNRAAAFGRLVLQLTKAETEKAALLKELEQYKTTTPQTGGGIPPSPAPAHQSAHDAVFAALRAKAKPI